MSNYPPPPYSDPTKSGLPPDQYPPPAGGAPPPGYAPPQQPGYAPPPQQPGYAPPPQPGYAPPPQGYPQYSQPAPTTQGYTSTNTTTIIATQPTVIANIPVVFHESPVSMVCPSCRANIVSSVVYEPGTFAWLLFFLMCVFGFWICCFFPFCIDSCKDTIHSCPNCHIQLGVFRRM